MKYIGNILIGCLLFCAIDMLFPPGCCGEHPQMSANEHFNREQVPARSGGSIPGQGLQGGAPPRMVTQPRPSSAVAGSCSSGLQPVPSISVSGPPPAQRPGSTASWCQLPWPVTSPLQQVSRHLVWLGTGVGISSHLLS